MNSNTASPFPSILGGRTLSQVRAGWWVLFVVYTIFTIFAIWQQLVIIDQQVIKSDAFPYLIAINITIDVISWCLAIMLFLRKSNEWVIILVSMMFFLGGSAQPFWLWIFNHGWGDFSHLNSNVVSLSQIFAQPFSILAAIVNAGVFLTFPTGQWISHKAKRLFRANIIFLIVVSLFLVIIHIAQLIGAPQFVHKVEEFGGLIGSLGGTLFRLLAGYMLFIHYRDMQNSIQRQQIKWIVVFFVGGVCASALATLFYAPLAINLLLVPQENFYDFMNNVGPWVALPSSILNLGLVIAFSIAIFRYRLWDVDVLINKTLVYSSLTALLGLLFLVSAALISYFIKQWFGEADSSIWAAVISALPVATAFNPLREKLQKWVDRYYKPEEVNFSNTFVEFTPQVREILTTSKIIQTLSEQVKKQLNVDFAKVFLFEQDNNLQYAETTPISEEQNKLVLEDKQLAQLKNGKVVVDSDGIPFSLLVPLFVQRARIPDFLGVIVLGRRLEGKGYSTQILNNLQALGADAGTAIYLSQLSEQAKQKKTS